MNNLLKYCDWATKNGYGKEQISVKNMEIFCEYLDFLESEYKNPNKIFDLLSDDAKRKLNYINGSCIAREFPDNKPTLEWAGAVLDLLKELKIDNVL
jgi:hypothetical protein